MLEDLPCCCFLTLPLNKELIQQQHQLVSELQKTVFAKCLGENVCHLLICLYVLQPNGPPLNTISQEVVPDVYMLAPVMEHWILKQHDGTLIITMNYCSLQLTLEQPCTLEEIWGVKWAL